VNPALFKESAENGLWGWCEKHEATLESHRKAENYGAYLEVLTTLSTPLAAFFEAVMIMDEDFAIRSNRLALLAQIGRWFEEMGMII
jgi:glycyl-tRNA synthetase beta chain